jgi:hypothetical protein
MAFRNSTFTAIACPTTRHPSWAALFSFLKATPSATVDPDVGYYHNVKTCEGEGKGWKTGEGHGRAG